MADGLAERLLEQCRLRRWTLAAAESDTGGLVLQALTSVPGSSAVVLGGVVAYHDGLKRALLGVSDELLLAHGAVSAAVAEAMASGVRRATMADVGLATTGIAGPGGATPTKPVGLAWVAVAHAGGVTSREHRWQADRAGNRRSSARAVLELALTALDPGFLRSRTDVLE